MHVLLIDGLNLIRRVYAGVPGEEGSPAHVDDAINASVASVKRAVADTQPTHAIMAMDRAGLSWRHTLYSQYKANRAPMPEALRSALPQIEQACAEIGVVSVGVENFEADDVLASIACRLATRMRVTVLSTDKGILPLLTQGVAIRHHFDRRNLNDAYVQERFGVRAQQLTDWLALVGESALNIPGVPSFGPKTATRLLCEHGDIDTLLSAQEGLSDKQRAVLDANAEDLQMWRQLFSLRTDLDVGLNLADCRLPHSHHV